MEGPTVATTETPAVLSARAFSSADDEATRAQPGPPVARADGPLDPPPDEEEAKRTMRLDRPRSDVGFDPTPPAPFTPVHGSAANPGLVGGAVPASPPRRPETVAPVAHPAVSPQLAPPPLVPPPHLRAATREQPTPAPRGQPGWLPHREPPRPPPPEPVKPRAIRIAELALAALVVITLSIGGCLLMQNR